MDRYDRYKQIRRLESETRTAWDINWVGLISLILAVILCLGFWGVVAVYGYKALFLLGIIS